MPTNPYMQQYMQLLQQMAGTIPGFQQPQQQPQALTPPMRHVDIVPVDSEAEVERYSVGNGQTLAFMMKDDSTIFFKTGSPTGGIIEYFDRRTTQPRKEPEYVTKEYLDEVLASLKPQRKVKKEEDNEPV